MAASNKKQKSPSEKMAQATRSIHNKTNRIKRFKNPGKSTGSHKGVKLNRLARIPRRIREIYHMERPNQNQIARLVERKAQLEAELHPATTGRVTL